MNDVAGVCWGSCNGDVDVGALCRERCKGDTPYDVLGVCWGRCAPGSVDVGALCRDGCREGFHDVAGVCWGNKGTYARNMRIPTSIQTYDPGYQPPKSASDLPFAWCNFASPVMLDAMAQFYYDQSTLNPVTLNDGRIQYEFIIKFYGLIASSELSCDVACMMRTVTYDPVTGDKYSQQDGALYPNDQGNFMSYRRFYFINTSGVTRGETTFTVTACTHTDGTAPDAEMKSSDPGVDPLMSLPKVFIVKPKNNGVSWSNIDYMAGAAAAVNVGIGVLSSQVGTTPRGKNMPPLKDNQRIESKPSIGAIAIGVGGGMAGNAVANIISNMSPQPPRTGTDNFIVQGAPGDVDVYGNPNMYVSTNNDNFTINHGVIYEQAQGFIPSITFCGKFIIQDITCTNPYILSQTIDTFHQLNPNIHIKQVDAIETRGRNGCYYKFKQIYYDPLTNKEGNIITENEIVMQYSQPDMATCVYVPDKFTTDLTNYPIKSYVDLMGDTQYPTRNVSYIPTISARYVRIRPPTVGGDGILTLSQVIVNDATMANIALNKTVFATSSFAGNGGAAAPSSIIDGTTALKSWPYWASAGGWPAAASDPAWARARISDYIEIDLGSSILIDSVVVYASADYDGSNPAYDRVKGIRVQLLNTNGPNASVISEQVLPLSVSRQAVTFSIKTLTPKYPTKPLVLPPPPVPEAALDSNCPNTKCQDRAQIDLLIKQYNADANNKGKILKVSRGVTPAAVPLRCDYEVEMVRTEANGKKTVSKDTVAMKVVQAPGTCTFNYSASLGAGTFIQDSGQLLSAVDTSGGVFTYNSITKTVTDIFSNIIAPLQAMDPVGLLKTTISAADATANSLLTSAATTQGLQGCPNTKCSDPGVLAAMMQRYNVDNNSPSSEFGVETHTMNRILKAGFSGTSSCDILFEDLYQAYDDILYDPVKTQLSTKSYRFKLQNIGNCQFQVAPGPSSVMDVSGDAYGISIDATTLTTPFTQAACTVNCRDPALLRSVKQRLETRYATPTSVPSFTSVTQSFLNGSSVCEYQMIKDLATKNNISNLFSTETDVPTYVSATFAVNPTGCTFSLSEATEYFPDTITTRTDSTTGVQNTYVNGVLASIPTLYDYDTTQPSPKVNTQVQILS